MNTNPSDDVIRRAAEYLTHRGNERLAHRHDTSATDEAVAPQRRRSRLLVGSAVVVAVLGGSGLAAAAITGSLPVSLPLFSSNETAVTERDASDGASAEREATDEGSTATTLPGADTIDADDQLPGGNTLMPTRPSDRGTAGGSTPESGDEISTPGFPVGPTISEVSGPGTVQAGTTLRVSWTVNSPGAQSWMLVGGPPGWVTWCPFPVEANRIGDRDSGERFEATCEVPATIPNGVYTAFVYAVDAAGNRSETPVDFSVIGGSSDGAAPVLSEVTLSTGVVQPGDTVVVRWRATDESGVDNTSPWVSGPNGFVVDPTTGEPVAQWILGTLVSGTTNDGIYEATLRISPNASAGTYQLWFGARDTLGNRTFELAQNQERGYGTFEILDDLIRLPVIR